MIDARMFHFVPANLAPPTLRQQHRVKLRWPDSVARKEVVRPMLCRRIQKPGLPSFDAIATHARLAVAVCSRPLFMEVGQRLFQATFRAAFSHDV